MRTAATKLSGEEYKSLKDYADSQGSSISAILRELAKGVTDGQTEPGLSKDSSIGARVKDICPVCGQTVHLVQGDDSSKLYFICLRCDWAAYIGHYKLPEQIEDYQKIKGAK